MGKTAESINAGFTAGKFWDIISGPLCRPIGNSSPINSSRNYRILLSIIHSSRDYQALF
jgi:hypothetical protein